MKSKTDKIVLAIVSGLLAVIIIVGTFLYRGLSDKVPYSNLNAGQTSVNNNDNKELAPDFAVYDSYGNSVKLSDFKGKPVVLNFWASWCGPCASEMPAFENVYKQYGDKVNFLIVNLTDGYQETKEKATQFIQENGYTFPIYFDSSSSAAMAYNVSGIPATYFIDEEGYIVAQRVGAMQHDTLLQYINVLLG